MGTGGLEGGGKEVGGGGGGGGVIVFGRRSALDFSRFEGLSPVNIRSKHKKVQTNACLF